MSLGLVWRRPGGRIALLFWLATTFDKNVPLLLRLARLCDACHQRAHLECIFPREALVAVAARKGFHRKMYPFVPFEVMVSVETLGALITLERAFVERCLRLAVQLLHLGSMPTVKTIRV